MPNESHLEPRDRSATDEVTPQALDEFEEILRSWVAENREHLEAGGLGNSRSLAQAVAHWRIGLADRQG